MLTSNRSNFEQRTTHVDLGVEFGANAIAGCKSIQGSRAHMEDTYQFKRDLLGDGSDVTYFGVFDGHGGDRASRFAAENLHTILAQHNSLLTDPVNALIESFHELDKRWLIKAAAGLDDGSTAVVAIVVENTLYVANAGDSRCVLGQESGVAVNLSDDHKPNREDELLRIEAAHGQVKYASACWRVQGILAVSRSFGDRRLKRWVIATPEVQVRKVKDDDRCLILASDGLWDVLSSQQAVDVVAGLDKDNFPHTAAETLVAHAYGKGSMDNITALVVDLRKL